MRSLSVLFQVIVLGVSYLRDCGPFRRRDEAGLARFADRFRWALMELGGVYIKLGQVLSTRPDLVDPIVATALEALLDKCPAEPLPLSIATIREELGLVGDEELPFTLLGEVSSASFGCVYRGQLKSGQVAAIKVLRRGSETQARHDLRFLRRLAAGLDLLAVTHRFRMADWVEELRRWTAEELDYRLEARKMTYIDKNLRQVGGIKIPQVHWRFTTRRMLTMEFLDGRWLSGGELSLNYAERSHAASVLFQAFLYQIFELGVFNADLHKGNLCLLPDGRVGMIDFGITGFASLRTRQRHLGLVAAFQKGALDDAFAAVLEIAFVPPDADLGAFRRAFEHEYYDWFLRTVQPDYPASERGAGSLMLAIFRRAFECSIVVDSEVVRYYRAFSIVDGVVTSLDTDFNQHDEIERYLRSRLRRQIEDRAADFFDPIGTLVGLSTELSFRIGEVRRAIYGASHSVDSAVSRVLLVLASIKRGLSRLAWITAFFALSLELLVRLDVLSDNAVLLRSRWIAKIEVRDVTSIILPTLGVALLLGWLGRLLRARVYSNSQSETESARDSQRVRR